MRVFLLHPDRNFDFTGQMGADEQSLIQDLELNTLFGAMGSGAEFLFDIAQKVMMSGMSQDWDTIIYRQDILGDCLKNPDIARDLYDLAIDAIESEKSVFFHFFSKSPTLILHRALEVLNIFEGKLHQLKRIASECAVKFDSKGFSEFFAVINRELDEDYFACIHRHLQALKFPSGVLVSAELGQGNKGVHYVLRKQQEKKRCWIKRIWPRRAPAYSFRIADRDESGSRALSEIVDIGINSVANALAQSADHILEYFKIMKSELAFYLGCFNLYKGLAEIKESISFPEISEDRRNSFAGLYDPCLALTLKRKVVANDMNADGKDLVIITGANQGGKSTFLRSFGISQRMMQCGMFVPAESFNFGLCDSLFTHFRREEDATMQSGKLDEELARMSDLADRITPNSLLLFNESFAATNDREGSEIAGQILGALLENGVRMFYVTHLNEFARSFYEKKLDSVKFLRAERAAGGTRTYRIVEGEPLKTSYGEDLYYEIFGKGAGE